MSDVKVPKIYLASASPRRVELLAQLGLDFETLSVDVDETHRLKELASDYVQRVASAKAQAGWQKLAGAARRPVLGADTAIALDSDILGKPRDRNDGITMLQRLSGRTHEVYSAVAIMGEEGLLRVRTQVSRVDFRRLSAAECEAYWETGEPRDKAGAYAIQGLAAIFIENLQGSYSGVMGLPLYETAELLREFDIEIFASL